MSFIFQKAEFGWSANVAFHATSPQLVSMMKHERVPFPTWFWSCCIFKDKQGVLLSTWVFPKIGVPQNGWFITEHPNKMDDLGGKPTIFGNIHLFWKSQLSDFSPKVPMFSSKTSPLSITISSCFLDSLTSSPDSPNFGSFGRLVKTSTLRVVFDLFSIDYGFNIKMTACSNTMRTILWIWIYSDMNVRIEKFDINVNTTMTMSLNMNIPCVNC